MQEYVAILPLGSILLDGRWPRWVLVYVCVCTCVCMHTQACAVVCELKYTVYLSIAVDFSGPTNLETTSYFQA